METRKFINDHVADWLQTLPIKDHIKEWKILHNSVIQPVKRGIQNGEDYDLKLHTRMIDGNNNTNYLVIGIIVK